MGFTLRRVYNSAAETLQQQHLREVVLLARSINNEMRSLARIAEDTAVFLDIDRDSNAEELYALLRQNAGRNPLLYGAAIAFEPGVFEGRPLFSPYVYDVDLKQMDIGDVTGTSGYDYTDGRWQWYTGVKEMQTGLWTEPYFDTGAGILEMTTYSHPVLRDGQFIGVTTIDLRLDQLASAVSSQLDGEMFMIMSPNGTFVSHYQPERALHGSLQDFGLDQENLEYEAVEDAILAGESGFASVDDLVIDGVVVPGETWFFYAPIPSTGWFLATLHSQDVLTQPIT